MLNSRRREIRIKADAFRDNCKINRYAIIDIFKECERCGYKLIRYPLGEDGDLGFVIKKDNDIVIFTNTSSRLSREIFTLAHELGHIVLHLARTNSFIDNAHTLSSRNLDEMEQEANYFAACLLMPDDEVGRFLDREIDLTEQSELSAFDIARLMLEFNVSFDMALNRLENLGQIDSAERIRLDNQRNQTRVGNLLRSVGGNSRLNEPSETISIPYEYINYVIFNYNSGAIPKETLEKALECYQLSIDDISDKLVQQEDMDDEAIDFDAFIGRLK